MSTKKNVKNDHVWKAMHESLNIEVPENLEKQLKKTLNSFRQDMREHPYIRKLEGRQFPLGRNLFFFSRRWVRPFLLGGIGLTVAIVVGLFILGNNPPTWAQVQERFGTMPFFAASIYRRNVIIGDQSPNPLAEPELIELWAEQGNRVRIRSGSKLTFVDKGEILNTFDLLTRSEDYPDSNTYLISNKLGKSNKFSLDSILMGKNRSVPEHIPKEFLEKLSSSGLVDTTSRVIPDAGVSEGIVVFDIGYFYNNALYLRARAWVLRQSRLPIRIVMWEVDRQFTGQLVRSPMWDIIFNYSMEPPKEFFEPKAFAAKLEDQTNSIEDLLYMFHQHAGGNL